ncbi:hypothetical protein AADZ86_17350 [Colwelliaceae bacterium BS250]
MKHLLILCLILICSACANTGVDKPTTIAEVISLCNDVNESTDIPVKCNAEYIKDKAVITIVFPDLDTAKEWDGKAIEYLGAPFCNASNSVNRQSFLIFAIEDIAKGRYYECESQTYSEWFTLNPEDIPQNYEISEDKQTLLNKTLTTCEELHTSKELDLSCTFELVENKPMMYLAFLNSNSMANNSINVNKTLLTPLCHVFEHLDTGAFFFIINVEEDEGLLYSCKIDQFSDWFDINSKMDDAKKKLSM